jgi:hypothetical protein
MTDWFRPRAEATTEDGASRAQGARGPNLMLLPGGGDVHVVGESRYQRELQEIAGGKTREGVYLPVVAALVPEPENPADRNAIAVQIEGKKVGYLSRQDAAAYRALAQRLRDFEAIGICAGEIRGGWKRAGDEGYFGVILTLAPAEAIIAVMGEQ